MNRQNGQKGTVLAVVNRKGGVAKTTTAINLAHGLSRKFLLRVDDADLPSIRQRERLYQYRGRHYYIGGHVLLIDFDPQGHCARGLGVEVGTADLGNVLLGRQSLTHGIISTDRADNGYPRPNLWLLPASDNLETAKETLRSQAFLFKGVQTNPKEDLLTVLKRRLDYALQRFDFVILDCPPSVDSLSQAVYEFADGAIVPVKPDYFSVAGTRQHIEDIHQAQLRGIQIDVHTIVPTFNVARQRLDQQMVQMLQDSHGERVSMPIPRSQMVAEAPAHQRTLFEFDPRFRNPATIAYQKLVDRVYHGKTK